jgi:pSer/pThr/pTyr-binding forkhead associated (FHA) protein
MYKLVIQDDEGKTTVVPLIRDELTIGRKEGNTIRLTERNVSRQHARLTRANGTIVIEDLNSYNGIRVNGSRIQGRATIKEADRVQIGDYLIEVRSDAVAAEGTSPGQDETQPLERVEGSTPPAPTVPSMPVAEPPPPVAGVAREPVGLADTDPGRAAGTSVSNHGRLVVLSTNFAGQEFVLDKTKMVIGRTDDNQIWLNHRSISRHHAQIKLENGRYSIEDLQSSNGVRVNGEEYGKVELRRADVIDLGHVRLRFIEPGEDFIFGRDAQAVDVTPYSGGKTWLWLGLAGVALIGAIIILFAMQGGDEKEEGGGGGTGTDVGTMAQGDGDGTGTGTMAVAIADASTPEVQPDAMDEDELNRLKAQEKLAEAKKLLAAEKISEARLAIDTAKSLDPDDPEIDAISKRIESLLDQADAVEEQWTQFVAAVRNSGKSSSARLVKNMAGRFNGTDYQGKVAGQVRESKDRYKRALLARARRAKDCDERDVIARTSVWNDLSDDVRRIKCTQKPGPGTGTGTGTGTAAPVDKQKDYEDAINAYNTGGSITKAFNACNKVRGLLWVQKCVAIACRNQNRSRAQVYLNRIKGKETRDRWVNQCISQGVEVR